VSIAAAAIVDVFRATDGDRDFGLFAPEPPLVFRPELRRLDFRAEYETI
jgi:hypothetical protein